MIGGLAGGIEVLCVHHVGIAVASVDEALDWYRRVLGAQLELRRELPEQGVDAASLLVGNDTVELVAPLEDGTALARFIERRGPGMHHVAYGVPSVSAALATLAKEGLELVDATPRRGLHGTPVAFVHPRGMFGVLTELVEVPHEEGEPHA